MRVPSTAPPFEERKRGTANTFVPARSFLRFGVEEIYAGLTKKKICKDMLRKCSAGDSDWSRAHAANADAAPESVIPDPARDAKPVGIPGCKNAGTNVHEEA
jgi:hypothetical protein